MWKNNWNKRRFKILSFLVLIITISFFFITPVIVQTVLSREAKLNFIDKIGIERYEKMKRVFFSVSNLKYSALRMKNSDIPQVYLYAESGDLSKITENITQVSSRKKIKGTMNYDDKEYSILMKVKGGGETHWQNDKKSWGVIADDTLFEGQQRVDFIIARDRGFLQEAYSNFIAQKMGLITPQYRFIDLFINDERQGLYFELEHWSKEAVEKAGLTGDTNFYGDAGSLQDSYVEPQKYTKNPHDERDTTTDLFTLEQIANHPDDKYFWDNIFSIIDKENFFIWQSHSVILRSAHQHSGNNVKLYFNNTKGLFEFFPWDINAEGDEYIFGEQEISYNKLVTRILKNPRFMYERNKALYGFIKDKDLWKDGGEYYKDLKKDIKPSLAKDSLKTLSTKSAFRMIDNFEDNFENWRDEIEDKIEKGGLEVRVDFSDKKSTIVLTNNYISPVNIERILFFYKDKQSIPNKRIILTNSGGHILRDFVCDEEELVCSVGFEDELLIFSDREIIEDEVGALSFLKSISPEHYLEISGDIGDFDHVMLESKNSVTGKKTKDKNTQIIYIDNKQFENLKDINMSAVSFSSRHKSFLLHGDSELSIGPGSFFFDKNVIIPKETILTIQPNTTLTFKKDVSLLSYSPVHAEGLTHKSIKVVLDGGIFGIVTAPEKSTFKNCVFYGGGQSAINGIFLSGMLSSYHSDINIEKCEFRDASGDDAVNAKYSKIEVEDNIFHYNAFDALDVDFAKKDSYISKNIFINNGNDSIDLSGSFIDIKNNQISSSGDKCVSVGEKSIVLLDSNMLQKCSIGVAVKDSSEVIISNNIIVNNDEGVSMYQKKEIFGGGKSALYNNVFWDNIIDLKKDSFSDIIDCESNIVNSAECRENINTEPIFDENYTILNISEIEIFYRD